MQFVKNLLIASKENKYRPHIIRRHGLALSLVLIIAVQFAHGLQLRADGDILGFATNTNQTDLLAHTNHHRTAHGLPIFLHNSKLETGAQNKANHMIANDYWSHIAPDGTTPWFFFDQAGYAYLVAGENLAYGFDTSLGVVNGWMASQSHKDNILLPAFEEIGFGIANSTNFQGGENTVVVAFYGDPVNTVNPPLAAPVQVSPPPPPPPLVAVASAEVVTEAPPTAGDLPLTNETDTGTISALTFLPQTQKQITNFDSLLSGSASWAMYSTVMILGLMTFAYLYRHIFFINVAVARGEHLMVSHPLLESSLIFIALWLLLSASYGMVL